MAASPKCNPSDCAPAAITTSVTHSSDTHSTRTPQPAHTDTHHIHTPITQPARHILARKLLHTPRPRGQPHNTASTAPTSTQNCYTHHAHAGTISLAIRYASPTAPPSSSSSLHTSFHATRRPKIFSHISFLPRAVAAQYPIPMTRPADTLKISNRS